MWRRGDGLPTVWSCGGDSGSFCHRVHGAEGGGGREQFGVTREEVLGEILLFRERTEEKVERSIVLLEMWRRRRREMDREMQGPAHQ